MLKYMLVRWVEEESVGVMPSTAVHKEDKAKAIIGDIVRLKWSGKQYYDAEILKTSGELLIRIFRCVYHT